MRLLYLILILSIVVVSCSDKGSGEEKKEPVQGVLTYEIKYLQDESENALISLLPVEMIIKYKDNSIAQKIEGWGGVFTMQGIVDYKNGTNSALLKVLGKKYHFEATLESMESFGFDDIPGMKIEYIEGEEKEIIGFNCKKAMVYLPDTAVMEPFEIYYTEELELENPNRNTPFQEIPGVLMEYQMTFQKIPMVLKIMKHEKVNVEDSEFKVPDDYTKVSKEELQEFINTLI